VVAVVLALLAAGCGLVPEPNAPSDALDVTAQQQDAVMSLAWSVHDAWHVARIERASADGAWITLMDASVDGVRTSGHGRFQDDTLVESGIYRYRLHTVYDEDETRTHTAEALFDGVRAGTDPELELPADVDGDGRVDGTVDAILVDSDGDGRVDAISFGDLEGTEPMGLTPESDAEGSYTVDLDGDGSPDLRIRLGAGDGDEIALESNGGDPSHVVVDASGAPVRVATDGEPNSACEVDADVAAWLGETGSEARWPVHGGTDDHVVVRVVSAFRPNGRLGSIDVDGDGLGDVRVLARREAGAVCAYELDVNADGRLDLYLRGGLGVQFDTAPDMTGDDVRLAVAPDGLGFDADGDGVPDAHVTDPLRRNLLGHPAGPMRLPASGALGSIRARVVGEPPAGLDLNRDGVSDWTVEPTEPAGRYLVDTGHDGTPDVLLDARWFQLRFLDLGGTHPIDLVSDASGDPRGFDVDGDGAIDLGVMDGDGSVGVLPPGTERPDVALDVDGGSPVDSDGDGLVDVTVVDTADVARAALSSGTADAWTWWIDGVLVRRSGAGATEDALPLSDVGTGGVALESGRRYHLTVHVEVPASPAGPEGTVSATRVLILEGDR
jgi:hypothetical protein